MIIIASYLSICSDCGQHGHIILPDGTKSTELRTRPQAYSEVARLLAEKKILKEEATHLRESIGTSQIPLNIGPKIKVTVSLADGDEYAMETHPQHATGAEEKPHRVH